MLCNLAEDGISQPANLIATFIILISGMTYK